ncbi:MucB/RseB C-terminal domain-containing protein [Motilimonas cestriensis]|uniref:MucB/RseB C-terminal domain-containing protein n=2 Tax=Motilimonas cestriensis TaxID=2742685 RepID=A0ABS8WG70_9GAMM|nr:MucB/RseB C-terminal domain-containing protein [Motilimonas cestriensis]MCE2597323.1 MucB/RseB C-terminal domain-containing protein [Motilimonas cestriensis]
MRQSYSTLNYDLSYIQVYEGIIEPKRLSHGVLDGVEISYLSYLNGPPTEYVQRGKNVSFFEPDIEPYTLATKLLQGTVFQIVNQDLTRLQKSYDFVQAGKSRVAGRPAQVIRMSPKDADRYGYLLWLDRHTSLPLRIDTLDQHGQLVEQMMAISLRLYNEATPWIAELAAVELPAVVKINPSASHDDSQWRLDWVPKGFELVSSDRHSLPLTGDTVDYFMLSDGVSVISVYVEPDTGNQNTPEPVARKGATNLITINQKGKRITVVGDIPAETGLRIARAIAPELSPQTKGNLNGH